MKILSAPLLQKAIQMYVSIVVSPRIRVILRNLVPDDPAQFLFPRRIIDLVIFTFIIYFLSSLLPFPAPLHLLRFAPRSCFINIRLLLLRRPIKPQRVLLRVR